MSQECFWGGTSSLITQTASLLQTTQTQAIHTTLWSIQFTWKVLGSHRAGCMWGDDEGQGNCSKFSPTACEAGCWWGRRNAGNQQLFLWLLRWSQACRCPVVNHGQCLCLSSLPFPLLPSEKLHCQRGRFPFLLSRLLWRIFYQISILCFLSPYPL